MKKGETNLVMDNSFGIVGVVFGILSIIFASGPGIVMGIVGLVFSIKQKKTHPNRWSKSGFVLNIVGIILGIAVVIAVSTLLLKSGTLAQLQGAA